MTTFRFKSPIQADVPTANGRIYPKEVLEKLVSDSQKKVKDGTLLVHQDFRPQLSAAQGVVRDLRMQDGRISASVELLDLPQNNWLLQLLKCGTSMGLGMMGAGNLKNRPWWRRAWRWSMKAMHIRKYDDDHVRVVEDFHLVSYSVVPENQLLDKNCVINSIEKG